MPALTITFALQHRQETPMWSPEKPKKALPFQGGIPGAACPAVPQVLLSRAKLQPGVTPSPAQLERTQRCLHQNPALL